MCLFCSFWSANSNWNLLFLLSISVFNGKMQISSIIKVFVVLFFLSKSEKSVCAEPIPNELNLSVKYWRFLFIHSVIGLSLFWSYVFDFWHRYRDCMNEICLNRHFCPPKTHVYSCTYQKSVPNTQCCEHISHSTRL